jgi:hypothetical protein
MKAVKSPDRAEDAEGGHEMRRIHELSILEIEIEQAAYDLFVATPESYEDIPKDRRNILSPIFDLGPPCGTGDV